MEQIARYNQLNDILLEVEHVFLPLYRPSKKRIILNLDEIKMLRIGDLYFKEESKKYGPSNSNSDSNFKGGDDSNSDSNLDSNLNLNFSSDSPFIVVHF